MVDVNTLSREYGIPPDDVRLMVNSALSQFDAMVTGFLRNERWAENYDSVMEVESLIIANALDQSMPRDMNRADGRAMLRGVVRPRLREVEQNPGSFDTADAIGRLVDDTFPLETEENTNRLE